MHMLAISPMVSGVVLLTGSGAKAGGCQHALGATIKVSDAEYTYPKA